MLAIAHSVYAGWGLSDAASIFHRIVVTFC